ncbi:hypothetical protein [Pseudobacteroides cellulosolvens]|uniref:Uncharacterized protein n=1 Tax=Pseudobacteroides cellulosolvens ATCC 35603 = DSM 2933 TaxID=398512 RepID=A0A0L6JW56_9FIRM|nr:hypothetical protein [Pseudobacteroides cellulosolvens]KNY30096.1 hypothetical protein Bccel_5373 [Pseudobacteroides cellulosolvens ATCC 35603 = DSM 2933]
MFDKIFQDYEGFVPEIAGLKVSKLKAILAPENNDEVIFIWIGTNSNSDWYRIFIDGCYCGINHYKKDLSSKDLDEDVVCIDYDWIDNEIIAIAKVELGNKMLGDSSILLTIEFLSGKKLLLYCYDHDGECKLELISP